ncbi:MULTISPECIES: 50S ribosomal protein L11 [Holospora]|uniref:Large ribosomal subunit protein uL11 n=2 Tax=Holospora TaxID=44747 RepID=A0A061JHB4_9PROT|nr:MULTISPECIES: 50S ribosomal protein L11 [Holospora]ETZ04682.1 50S ribosomal protein L11 [Holospora undulata HU1]GAJ46237.1 50S ribosomal protein L11 [Holospora elegans E1]
MTVISKESKKRVPVRTIRLKIGAGEATPKPPVGPALGQHGLNIQDFCKAFNAKTQHLEKGAPVKVLIDVYGDRKFDFRVTKPVASYLLKKAASIQKGSSSTGKSGPVATLSRTQLEEIAAFKMEDMNAYDVASAVRTLEGSARSLGIEIKD